MDCAAHISHLIIKEILKHKGDNLKIIQSSNSVSLGISSIKDSMGTKIVNAAPMAENIHVVSQVARQCPRSAMLIPGFFRPSFALLHKYHISVH